jgi:hypothetical protein
MNNAIQMLSDSEVDMVSGGAEGCYYGGQLYSAGATITLAGGGTQTCIRDNATGFYTWSKVVYNQRPM